jgi:hypothetical protein
MNSGLACKSSSFESEFRRCSALDRGDLQKSKPDGSITVFSRRVLAGLTALAPLALRLDTTFHALVQKEYIKRGRITAAKYPTRPKTQ